MQLTLTTTLMAILTTGVFLTFLTICLINKHLLIRFGYKLLALFILFTFLRFSLPVEFHTLAHRIALPEGISNIIALLRHRLFTFREQPVSIWRIFEYIWIMGAVCGILWFFFTYFRDSYRITLYGKDMTTISPYKELVARICSEQNRRNNFRVIEFPGLGIPMIFGVFSPRILIPEHFELPEEQTYYILRHEMTHHFHHDLLLKSLIKLITLIYWWNPLCRLLNHQTDVILEMHVDDSLTQSDIESTLAYMNCLVDYASKSTQRVSISHTFSLEFFPKEDSDLKKRFYLMANNQKKSDRPLSILICFLVLGIYLSSYLFIFEAYKLPTAEGTQYAPPDGVILNLHVIDETTSYFIDNGDGTYDLYSDDMYLETMTSIDGYYSDTPIYTPDNNPYKTE